jgi:hypothetical protein
MGPLSWILEPQTGYLWEGNLNRKQYGKCYIQNFRWSVTFFAYSWETYLMCPECVIKDTVLSAFRYLVKDI